MTGKVALGSVGLISTSALGLGTYYLTGGLSPQKSISSLFKEDDYSVVMKSSDKFWKTKWSEYESSSNAFGIKDPSLEKLKSTCEGLLGAGKAVNEEDPLYLNFLKFCIRDKTTGEKLASLGKSIMSSNTENDTNWLSRFSRYKSKPSKDKFTHFSTSAGDTDMSGFWKLKNGCNDLTENAWREVEGEFTILESWCLVDSPNN
ncbi:hypothetical protein HF1_04360 [Mycoplasma haemofelis str. Langford 1]|uniref:Uncharacterized protein n=1 Tax=Mycoplasma haemofelis (strain Langford 1) TaxID=941640 RepID=E8ZH23_MYCHL|nr:hypothetical protein [Mycoplasma haemofelis]CBY92444.1 hypothetical protein HF1_04360 [Mycoplasma haemofelis str. Langford 1]